MAIAGCFSFKYENTCVRSHQFQTSTQVFTQIKCRSYIIHTSFYSYSLIKNNNVRACMCVFVCAGMCLGSDSVIIFNFIIIITITTMNRKDGITNHVLVCVNIGKHDHNHKGGIILRLRRWVKLCHIIRIIAIMGHTYRSTVLYITFPPLPSPGRSPA